MELAAHGSEADLGRGRSKALARLGLLETGEIVDRLTVQSFEKAKEKVSIQYFLVRD